MYICSNDKDGLRMREEWIKYSNAAYERQQVIDRIITVTYH